MSDFLQEMAEASAVRAAALGRTFKVSEAELPLVPLRLQNFDVIAEIKDRSPAEGVLVRAATDRATRARDYAAGGAAAISVLTEPSRFSGELAHLREVVAAVAGLNVPVMRKDFLVQPVQLSEARAAGASGVLLIAAILSDTMLSAMLDRAYALSLFVLLEAFDEQDLARCNKLLRQEKHASRAMSGSLLFGINTRDLRTLAVDPGRLAQLAPQLPANAACVAESGLHTADDAAKVGELGYRLALVGTALMKSAQPAALLADMLRAGRRSVPA